MENNDNKQSAYSAPGVTDTESMAAVPNWNPRFGELILTCLADHYRVTIKAITGKRRPSELAYIRHLFCYWMRNHYPRVSCNVLGQVLGNRDHTTVLYSVQEFSNRIETQDTVPVHLSTDFYEVQADYFETSKLIRQCLLASTER